MRKSRVLQKLRKGQPALITQLHFTDESAWELAALYPFDGIWMDLEHHFYSLETAGRLVRATRTGNCDVIARPARGEFMRAARILETGASGIMYPRCEDAAEAEEIVRNVKFAPEGIRGFDGGNPDMPYCSVPIAEYIREANAETLVVVQIETPQAVENVDAIAKVKGVDALFFGPADFSVLSGIPGEFDHGLVQSAIRRVESAAAQAGIHWGMPCFTPEHAGELLERGARFLCHGADIVFLKQRFEAVCDAFRDLGHGLAEPV